MGQHATTMGSLYSYLIMNKIYKQCCYQIWSVNVANDAAHQYCLWITFSVLNFSVLEHKIKLDLYFQFGFSGASHFFPFIVFNEDETF